jgi:hypothetical protein
LPPGDEHVLQQGTHAAAVGLHLLGGVRDARRQVVFDHRLQQFFLAGVIQVQRALGHAGTQRHLLDARGSETLLDEQRQRRLEQFGGPGFLSALAAG